MSTAYQDLAEKIFALEQRVSRLEAEKKAYLSQLTEEKRTNEEIRTKEEQEVQLHLESNIGEYGLAWIGNIVLFFGIIFLVEYLRISGSKIIPSLFGIGSVTGIFGLAYYFRKINPNMSNIFSLNGYLLSFYVVLKMHFFSPDPLISNKNTGLILLILGSGALLFLSIRKKYSVLAGLSLIFIAITAIVSDNTHLMLFMASLIATAAVILLFRFGWMRVVILSIFLVYMVHLMWIVNNPIMDHTIGIITSHQYGFLHLFTAMAIFSIIALVPEREGSYNSDYIIGAVILSGVGFAFMAGVNILSFFTKTYSLPLGILALFLMAYSIVLDKYSHWKFTAGLYALSGFVALSLCIKGIYDFPRAYTLLAIQSLLVVSFAIWFRSKFIVIMNSLLFLFLLIGYLSTAQSGNVINVSFSMVALVTARILNWKKERLTIHTDLIRNLYLFTAFFMVLYMLYHLIPKEYVTFSWTLAAALYFLLSVVLKNVKYRYMALGTMISAALYLFAIDLARVELIYRIIALLFLALISIAISFYYSSKKSARQMED